VRPLKSLSTVGIVGAPVTGVTKFHINGDTSGRQGLTPVTHLFTVTSPSDGSPVHHPSSEGA
jgi:hypothetical protein